MVSAGVSRRCILTAEGGGSRLWGVGREGALRVRSGGRTKEGAERVCAGG